MVVKGMAATADIAEADITAGDKDRATILDEVTTDMEGIIEGIITTGMADIMGMVGMVITVGFTGAKRATALGDVEGTHIKC